MFNNVKTFVVLTCFCFSSSRADVDHGEELITNDVIQSHFDKVWKRFSDIYNNWVKPMTNKLFGDANAQRVYVIRGYFRDPIGGEVSDVEESSSKFKPALSKPDQLSKSQLQYVNLKGEATGRKLLAVPEKGSQGPKNASAKSAATDSKEKMTGFYPSQISALAYLMKKRVDMFKRFLNSIESCLRIQLQKKLITAKEEALARKALRTIHNALTKDVFTTLMHYSQADGESSETISPGRIGVLKAKIEQVQDTMNDLFNQRIVKLVRIGMSYFYDSNHKVNVKRVLDTVEKLRLLPAQYGNHLTKIIKHIKKCVHNHEFSRNQEKVFRIKFMELIENFDQDMRDLLDEFKIKKNRPAPTTYTKAQLQKLQFARRHADLTLRHIRELITKLTKEAETSVRAYLPDVDHFDIASFNKQIALRKLQKQTEEALQAGEKTTADGKEEPDPTLAKIKRATPDESNVIDSKLADMVKEIIQRRRKALEGEAENANYLPEETSVNTAPEVNEEQQNVMSSSADAIPSIDESSKTDDSPTNSQAELIKRATEILLSASGENKYNRLNEVNMASDKNDEYGGDGMNLKTVVRSVDDKPKTGEYRPPLQIVEDEEQARIRSPKDIDEVASNSDRSSLDQYQLANEEAHEKEARSAELTRYSGKDIETDRILNVGFPDVREARNSPQFDPDLDMRDLDSKLVAARLANYHDDISHLRSVRGFIKNSFTDHKYMYLGLTAGVALTTSVALTVYLVVKKKRANDDGGISLQGYPDNYRSYERTPTRYGPMGAPFRGYEYSSLLHNKSQPRTSYFNYYTDESEAEFNDIHTDYNAYRGAGETMPTVYQDVHSPHYFMMSDTE